jgi:hypothetical protein
VFRLFTFTIFVSFFFFFTFCYEVCNKLILHFVNKLHFHDQKSFSKISKSEKKMTTSTSTSSSLPNWVFPVVLVISWIFWVASAATPILRWGWGYYGWKGACNNGNCAYGGCSSFVDTARASYAFAVITVVILSLALIFGIGRIFFSALSNGALAKATIVLLILSLISGALAWILGFAAADASWCGYSYTKDGGGTVGPSAPLGIVGWFVAIVAAVMEWGGHGGGKGEKVDVAGDSQHNHNHTAAKH